MFDFKSFLELKADSSTNFMVSNKQLVKIRPKYNTEYEDTLLKKYKVMNDESLRQKPDRRSTRILQSLQGDNMDIINSLTENYSEIIKSFRSLCSSIKSDEEAKFYLEAVSYNIEEAERLFNEQSVEVQETINVIMVLPDKREVKHKVANTESLWEIGSILYAATKDNREFKVINSENNKVIGFEEMTSMNFKDYGFKNQCTLKIEFIN